MCVCILALVIRQENRISSGPYYTVNRGLSVCHMFPRYLNNGTIFGEKIVEHKIHRGVDKSLARPGRKQATATEDFDIHISYL